MILGHLELSNRQSLDYSDIAQARCEKFNCLFGKRFSCDLLSVILNNEYRWSLSNLMRMHRPYPEILL